MQPDPISPSPNTEPVDTDAIVIGLGPVGLYQVFQLGLLGMRVQAIDSLSQVGGQCRALYADKQIHDIAGFRSISGAALADALLKQIEPFSPGLHLGQTVDGLARLPDHRIQLSTAQGLVLRAPIVVLAVGAGAWHYRPLDLPGAEHHRGTQIFETPQPPEHFAGQRVVVLGGGNEALQQSLDLLKAGAHVTLVHRRARFSHYATDPALVRAVDEQAATGRLRRVTGQPIRLVAGAEGVEGTGTGATGTAVSRHGPDAGPSVDANLRAGGDDSGSSSSRLRALVVSDSEDGHEIELPLDALLLCQGLSPTLAPLADWGVALEKRYIPVQPENCATDIPGIFAVGDVCTYPGKLKLITCGFHEATLAAHAALAWLSPKAPPFEYTAISLRLQRRLGVLTEEALAARLRPHIQFPDGF